MLLPRLPFLDSTAPMKSDAVDAAEAMARVVPSLVLTPDTGRPGCFSKVATCKVGDIAMLAHAMTPCRMEVEQSQGWHLIFPTVGTAVMEHERKRYGLRSGNTALLLPNVRRSTERSLSSLAIAKIDERRLESVFYTMYRENVPIFFAGDHPQILRIHRQKNLYAMFLYICNMIDLAQNSEIQSEILGLDDLIYRWAAMAIRLTSGNEDLAPSSIVAPLDIDPVCDLIRSSTERPLTLTELEAASGLSRRSLQYAFKRRFDCTPMEWQRRERLDLAHTRLCSARLDESVTSIAYSLGYTSSSAFTTLYRTRFGETPSQTVAKYC